MKKIIIGLVLLSLIGCGQQRYRIPEGKTQSDFLVTREECTTAHKQINFFLIGPAIIIFPIVGVIAGVNYFIRKNFTQCMNEQGYELCNNNCPEE